MGSTSSSRFNNKVHCETDRKFNTASFRKFILRKHGSKQNITAAAQSNPFAATHAVLSTTELLEQILSYLDVKDLIFLCRVSRYWHDVMGASLILRWAMFLTPEPERVAERHQENARTADNYFISYDPQVPPTDLHLLPVANTRINPLLLKAGQIWNISRLSRCVNTRDDSDDLKTSDALLTRMLVTQPPATRVSIGQLNDCVHDTSGRKREIHNPQGITFGNILWGINDLQSLEDLDPMCTKHDQLDERISRRYTLIIIDDSFTTLSLVDLGEGMLEDIEMLHLPGVCDAVWLVDEAQARLFLIQWIDTRWSNGRSTFS